MIVLLFTAHLNEKQDGRYVIHNMAKLYCPGHAEVKGNDRADRLVGEATLRNDRADRLVGKETLRSGLLLRRSEVLRSLRHYLQAQSQGHHSIDCLEERGKEEAQDDLS